MLCFFAAPRLALNPDPHFLDGFQCLVSEISFITITVAENGLMAKPPFLNKPVRHNTGVVFRNTF